MKNVYCCFVPVSKLGSCGEGDFFGIENPTDLIKAIMSAEDDVKSIQLLKEEIEKAALKSANISNVMIKVAKSINAPKVTPNPFERSYKNRRFKN